MMSTDRRWESRGRNNHPYKKISSNASQSEKPPTGLKRLSSLSNVISPLNPFKRSFSRSRKHSQDSSSSSTVKTRKGSGTTTHLSNRGTSTSYVNNKTRPPIPYHSSLAGVPKEPVGTQSTFNRSITTSFLPLPSHGRTASPENTILVQSPTTTSFRRTRIPTPANLQGRLPTPHNLSACEVGTFGAGHSRRESFLRFQSGEPKPPTRIPTPMKRNSAHCNNVKHIGASKAFTGVARHAQPDRSLTESNILSAVARKNVGPGRRESTLVEAFHLDSSAVSRLESAKKSSSSWGTSSNSGKRHTGVCLGDHEVEEIKFASYAFSSRKYTPSKALESALNASANVGPLRDQANMPRTPSTIKRLENPTAVPSQPRFSSDYAITHYRLLQPESPPGTHLPRILAPSKLQTPREFHANPNIQSRLNTTRPATLRMASELNSLEKLSFTTRTFQSSQATVRLIEQITKFQSTAFWAGRFSSQHDRLLTEAFDVDHRPTNSSDMLQSRQDTDGRLSSCSTLPAHAETELDCSKRIFKILESSCFSSEAVRSLKIFQNIYADSQGMRGLECEVPSAAIATTSTPDATKRLAEEYEASLEEIPGRKASFMNRLLIGRTGTANAPRMSNKSRKSSGKLSCDQKRKCLCPVVPERKVL